MKEVKVLGMGCAKCKRLESLSETAIQTAQVEANLSKLEELDDIMAYDILATPALVVDEKVVSSGRLPSVEEIVNWLKE